jgi:hypothetical protein
MSKISKTKAKELIIGRYRSEEEIDVFDEKKLVSLRAKNLLRHVMALGSSGSGKTVFCKVIVEEMLRLKIPCICIDPQGDLCSLALGVANEDEQSLIEQGIHPTLAKQFVEQTDAIVFSPASRVGVPLCADPFYSDASQLKGKDRLQAISTVASMLVSLLGYDLSSDDGEGLVAAFDHKLTQLVNANRYPKTLDQFTTVLENMGEEGEIELSRYIDQRKLTACLRKLARLDVGARRLLFHEGLPLNIDLLLGQGDYASAQEGKTRLSIIYLNSLHNAEDKDFFIAALAEQFYTWMLQHPSKTAQALFYIDEVAPFIPPVRKPSCKTALTLIFKQARKYGVSCLMATQNPGDVDYRAMAQFGTWAIGRLSTRQDIKKIHPTIKSLDPTRVDEIIDSLPSLQAGEFVLLSPDHFDHGIDLKTRWLYTPHETLDERRIEALCDQHWRERFLVLEKQLKKTDHEQYTSPESVINTLESTKTSDTNDNSTSVTKKSTKTTKKSKKSKSKIKKDESIQSDDETQSDHLSDHEESASSDQDRLMTYLLDNDSCDAKTAATHLKVSDTKARNILKSLVQTNRAQTYKTGRINYYFSLESGARPDLELPRQVNAFVAKLNESSVDQIAEDMRGKTFLGFIGNEEKFIEKKLRYHVLYQVAFSEMVSAGFLTSWFNDDKEVEDFIYIEPQTLKVLVYKPDSEIQLVDKPAEYASDIKDFDGVADLCSISPSEISFNIDAWKARQSIEVVQESLQNRFQLEISSINPIFLPLWCLRYKVQGSHQVRVVHIDALTGKQIII